MLSKNFSRKELQCKCNECNQDTIDYKLIEVIQWLRTHLGRPVIVTSGNRCPAHNTDVGGSKHSQHMESRAADIVVEYYSPKTIYDILDKQFGNQISLALYEDLGFVHVDSRTDSGKRW